MGRRAGFLLLAIPYHNATGRFDGVTIEGRPFWLHPFAGNEFVYAATLAEAAFRAFALTIAVGFALSAAGLLLPTLGVHRRIQQAKAAELEAVWRQVEEARGLGENDQLPGLLAYETRIAATREWPFDAGALRRLGLYLLIPVASWVGGALMERLVDAALG